jgi:ribosome-binding factor A
VSHKHEHLESSLERAVRDVISRGFNDPRISGLITVTSVRVTPDHTQALVNVSILPDDRSTLTMHGLTAAANHIRREAGELIRTRQMPQLVFRLDHSLKKQARVLDALDKAREDEAKNDTGHRGSFAPRRAPTEDDGGPS